MAVPDPNPTPDTRAGSAERWRRWPLSRAHSRTLRDTRSSWCLVLGAALALSSGSAAAESQLLLRVAGELEGIAATTFDAAGRQAVGHSSFAVATRESGEQHMTIRMGVDGGGSNVSEAILAPVASAAAAEGDESAPAFRLVEERSQAQRADGVTLDLLVIDHEEGRVSCYPPDGDRSRGRHVDLPEDDRVVNVPMQLLFQPLVRRETDTVRFQIAMCRDGPSLQSMVAVRGPTKVRDGRRVQEIRYGPDFGDAVAWIASRLLPRYSFWFDAEDGAYLGHSMPLHRKGPDVLLVRQGMAPPALGID